MSDNSDKKIYAAKFSVISNALLVLGKFVTGFVTGSISIISEAIHSSFDLGAAIIANYSVRKASAPADVEHRFGHGKYENVSALLEGILIFFAAYFIFHESYNKLRHGVKLEILDIGIAIMLVSTLANLLISRYLFRVAKETDSAALEADAWHLRTDVYTSAGVLGGLILIRLIRIPGIEILDPIIAMMTAVVIIRAAYVLSRNAISNLLDVRLPADEEEKILAAIKENTKQFIGFHALRTRKAGSYRYVDLHLVVPSTMSVDEAHKLADHVEKDIESSIENIDIIIHVEPCVDNCDECTIKCAKPKK
jgi:cation diffusion facilitator family transporter